MKSTKYHYVYKITNDKPTDERKYYIGVRSSKVKPEEDTKYQSSSKYLKEAIKEIGHKNFKKEILSIWESRSLANKEEIRLHKLYDVAKNPEYYNKARATSERFCTENQVAVFDSIDRKNKVVTKDEYLINSNYISRTDGYVNVVDLRDGLRKQITIDEFTQYDYYLSTSKGFVTVVDIRDNTTKHVLKEDFNKYDYYISCVKNMVSVTDTRDGSSKKVSRDDFEKFDYYVAFSKNTISAKDIRDGSMKRVTKEEFDSCDYLVSPTAKRITIYKSDDSVFDICYDDFRRFCKKHNLSFDALSVSYKNGGEPIFKNISLTSLNRLKKNSREFQIGWYATTI